MEKAKKHKKTTNLKLVKEYRRKIYNAFNPDKKCLKEYETLKNNIHT